MTNEEHYKLVEIFTGKPWEVRTRLGEFLKTVQVEEKPQKVSSIEKWGKGGSTGLVAPQEGIVEVNLDGTNKPPYPEYTGPVNWEPV